MIGWKEVEEEEEEEAKSRPDIRVYPIRARSGQAWGIVGHIAQYGIALPTTRSAIEPLWSFGCLSLA